MAMQLLLSAVLQAPYEHSERVLVCTRTSLAGPSAVLGKLKLAEFLRYYAAFVLVCGLALVWPCGTWPE